MDYTVCLCFTFGWGPQMRNCAKQPNNDYYIFCLTSRTFRLVLYRTDSLLVSERQTNDGLATVVLPYHTVPYYSIFRALESLVDISYYSTKHNIMSFDIFDELLCCAHINWCDRFKSWVQFSSEWHSLFIGCRSPSLMWSSNAFMDKVIWILDFSSHLSHFSH